MFDINSLKFNQDGLIPAVIQDFYTGRILTLAYMNRESLEISLAEKSTCFYSRSRKQLWRKGETSGNTQKIVSIAADCDKDSLLVRVIPAGPACHTGEESCFFEEIFKQDDVPDFSLSKLCRLINGRKTERQEGSYTSYLFEKGLDKILKKVGEESTEVIIAAKNNDNQELVYELADLSYHLLVLMSQQGITAQAVADELAKRHVVDKKIKQEKMR